MKKIKWGIVSTGRIAEKFCGDLMHVQNAEIYGVAARSLDSANAFANKFDISNTYEGYQAMFDDSEIDVVYIGTPHTLHYTNARDAILAGKHVLCEKPLVTGPEQCQELILLARERNVFLMEAMWTYFLPVIQKAKEWLDDGRIGRVRHLKIDFGYQMPYSPDCREYNSELAGGSLFDMGIYPLALTWFFLQSDIANVNVFSSNAPNGVDEDVSIFADCGGAKVTLACSFQCRLANTAYIVGDKGYIRIPNASRAVNCELYDGDDCIDEFRQHRSSYGYNYEIEEVQKQIMSGATESSIMPLQTSLKLQVQMAHIASFFSK